MAVSLRTRLTIWYSLWLLLALALFSAIILWLHWRLMLREADESLDALSIAAVNVLADELGEHATLEGAAKEMLGEVRNRDYALTVLDGEGQPLPDLAVTLPVNVSSPPLPASRRGQTVTDPNGREWRVRLRRASARGLQFTVAIAAPMREVEEHWRVLAQACALGVPFVMLAVAAGGWWLGRRGLRPLQVMADQARNITARTPDTRLQVANAGAELDAVATSFNDVLDRLALALATQRRFMADASHELRTPVSIIRTVSDVTLGQTAREEPEYRDGLTVVGEQATRLTRLVDDMLVLARADGGGYPIMRTEVDIDAVVLDCVRDFKPSAEAKDIRISAQVRPASAIADQTLLRRLIGNLLSNAITYTPAGGTVNVAILEEPGAISIQVTDSGPGIPALDRERVFERFVRLDPSRSEAGTGLGLAIARWIAEAHGGQLQLLRSDGHGSVFAATIPA